MGVPALTGRASFTSALPLFLARLAASTEPSEPTRPAVVEAAKGEMPAPATGSVPIDELDVKETSSGELVFTFGERVWRIRGWQKNLGPEQMRLNAQVRRGEAYHVDTLDVYSAKARAQYLKSAAVELGSQEDTLKRDLGRILLKLETLQDEAIRQTLTPKETSVELDALEHAAALEWLKAPNLIARLEADMARSGVVGERTNLVAGYLAAVSRKLDAPLAVLIQSSSAAGKSSLMDAVLDLMPDEERIQYSAMTGQSLFYLGETDLQHKILAIAEEEGVRQAAYALKLLQSDGETRTRRDHMKYLTLIRSVALLHQYQRPHKTVTHRGETLTYIEVTKDDIALANRIAHEVLGQGLMQSGFAAGYKEMTGRAIIGEQAEKPLLGTGYENLGSLFKATAAERADSGPLGGALRPEQLALPGHEHHPEIGKAVGAGGDLILNTTTNTAQQISRDGATSVTTTLGPTARIDVAGDAGIITGGDFQQNAGQLSVGGDFGALIGGDWTLGAQQTGEHKVVARANGVSDTNINQAVGSSVKVGGQSNVAVGGDLTARGAQLDLGQGGTFAAKGDVSLGTSSATSTVNSNSSGSDSHGSYAETLRTSDQTLTGTTLKSGDTVNVVSGKNIQASLLGNGVLTPDRSAKRHVTA